MIFLRFELCFFCFFLVIANWATVHNRGVIRGRVVAVAVSVSDSMVSVLGGVIPKNHGETIINSFVFPPQLFVK